MIANDPIEMICLIAWCVAGGVLLGVWLERRDWIAACRKRKLVHYDRLTGRLHWTGEKSGDVP